jgi:hypothetical protein
MFIFKYFQRIDLAAFTLSSLFCQQEFADKTALPGSVLKVGASRTRIGGARIHHALIELLQRLSFDQAGSTRHKKRFGADALA